MFRIHSLLLLTTIALAFAGCSPSEDPATETAASASTSAPDGYRTQTPAEIANSFMEATSAGDEEAFMGLLTEKARESMSAGESGGFTGESFESYEIGEESIQGEEASVAVHAVQDGEEQNAKLKMRRERGVWRIYAMAMELAPGSEITINLEQMGEMVEQMATALGDAISAGFEDAMGDWEQGGSEEEIAAQAAAFDALAPVSESEYESAWKVTKDYRGTPGADVVGELAESMQLSVYLGEHADALSADVTVDTRGMSKLEAIEQIAEAAGLQPVFPNLSDYGVMQAMVEGFGDALVGLIAGDDPVFKIEGGEAETAVSQARAEYERMKAMPKNAIQFEEREEGRRVLFAGPFHLRIADIEENVPNATGHLSVAAYAFGLPESMVSTTEESNLGISIDAVEDAQGRPLIDMDVSYFGGGQAAGSAFVDSANRDMKNMLREVESVEKISGSVALARPVDVIEFDFASLQPDVSIEKGAFRATLVEVGTNTRFKIKMPEGWEGDLAAKMQAYKADGSPMGSMFSDVSYWGQGDANAQMNTPEPPARVRIKLLSKTQEYRYPFELGPVALTRFAEQPEKLEELSFAGHDAPLSFELVKILEPDDQFGKIQVRIQNHSNKAPQSAFVDFVYLDAAGNELDSFPHTVNGEFSSDGWAALVEPHATTESEQTAFQMPAETKSIAFKINSLEFLDGTEWRSGN